MAALRATGALSLALLLAACAGPQQAPLPDRALLATAGPQAVRWVTHDGSERRAVAVADGVAWRGRVEVRPGDGLDFTLARLPGAPPGATEAVVETAPGLELARLALAPDAGWSRHRVDLAAAVGEAELVLRSEGPATVAWAEVSLVRQRPQPSATSRRPNLILISLDTVRADHLSLYGYARPTSPALDAFAESAWVFEESFSSSTWTLPSHGSLFTGLLPDQHGLQKVADALAPSAEPAAERLAAAGYRTAAITDGGFLGSRWGFAQGFERYDTTSGQAWEPKDAAVIFRRAADWVDDNRHHPFFLFVHTYEAHQPYINREGFADPFLDADYTGPFASSANVFRKDVDLAAERDRIVALYDGGLRRLDHYLGGFLEHLEATGLLASTAVVITSDHGEGMNEHGDFEHAHGEVFDEHLRVPLVVRPPGGIAGSRVATPVTSLDVLPTLLDFAGIDGSMEDESAASAEEPPATATTAALIGTSLRRLAAAPPMPDRAILNHGINSLQELYERRYRLRQGEDLVFYDRPLQELVAYRPEADPELREPRAPAADNAAVGRLARTLAWLSGGDYWTCFVVGRRLAPLPAAAVAVTGHWDGAAWRDGAPQGETFADRETCWSFEILAGNGPRAIVVDGAERRLARGRDAVGVASRGPLVAAPPLALAAGEDEVAVWPTAAAFEAERTTLDDAATAELRALGYLQ